MRKIIRASPHLSGHPLSSGRNEGWDDQNRILSKVVGKVKIGRDPRRELARQRDRDAPDPGPSVGTVSNCRLASLFGRTAEGGVSDLHSNLHRNWLTNNHPKATRGRGAAVVSKRGSGLLLAVRRRTMLTVWRSAGRPPGRSCFQPTCGVPPCSHLD